METATPRLRLCCFYKRAGVQSDRYHAAFTLGEILNAHRGDDLVRYGRFDFVAFGGNPELGHSGSFSHSFGFGCANRIFL